MNPRQLNHASLHHAIIQHVLDHGFAPSHAQLVQDFAVSPEVMTGALEALQSYHGVVLHPHQPEVWVIHPFSTAPTNFTVRQGQRLWWGNCAWCSLGVAALLGGTDITIDTSLGAEGKPITIHIQNHRVLEPLWVHFPVPMTKAWDNVIYTCTTMLAFASEAEIDAWSKRHAILRGDAQPIQHIYDFARVWYGNHLSPEWQKWTTEEAREIFGRFGLHGPTWDLPGSKDRF